MPRSRQVVMEETREQRIARSKERIFLLQVEERRFCAVLACPRRNEEQKVQAKKGLKDIRDALATFSKQLRNLESESWKPD